MPTDPTSWQVTDKANHINTVPTWHVEHDSPRSDKRTGKPKRVKKVFTDPAEAANFYERMREEERNPRGHISYVHDFTPVPRPRK